MSCCCCPHTVPLLSTRRPRALSVVNLSIPAATTAKQAAATHLQILLLRRLGSCRCCCSSRHPTSPAAALPVVVTSRLQCSHTRTFESAFLVKYKACRHACRHAKETPCSPQQLSRSTMCDSESPMYSWCHNRTLLLSAPGQ